MKCLFFLFFFASYSFSQTSDHAYSLYQGVEKSRISIPTITLLTDKNKISALQNPKNNSYYVSALISANINLATDGVWTTLENGDRLWQCRINSPGAKAISILYSDFNIPDHSFFHIYDESTHNTLGAFSKENNNEQKTFITDYIPSNTCVIEYYESKEDKGITPFVISNIGHFFRGVKSTSDFGESQKCMINANCSEGNNWRAQQKGVMRILVLDNLGQAWCTGTLINNTKYDGRPFILTARHCTETSTKSQINQYIYYFNYQGATCTNPATEPTDYSVVGSQLRASNSTSLDDGSSDFSLLELIKNVPSGFSAKFVGWRNTATPSPSGVIIHHPSGDIKKVSTYTIPTVSTGWIVPTDHSHWLVKYAATTNGKSVSEGGSSGAALLDNMGLIIGTLSGGESDCTTPSLPDYYGKMNEHWNPSGSDSAHQLKYWLDPIDSGVESIGLLDCDSCKYKSSISKSNLGLDCKLVYNSDYLIIQTDLPKFNFSIFNMEGKMIQTKQNWNSYTPITISMMDKGIYFIKIDNGNRFKNFKFVNY
jgi:hypothetical protein